MTPVHTRPGISALVGGAIILVGNTVLKHGIGTPFSG